MAGTKKTEKLSAFEQELLGVVKKINEYKLVSEANVVSMIYKNPDLLREANLKIEEFTNNVWRVYFTIANELIFTEKKESLDSISVNFYLDKHLKLKNKYEEYGEYELVESAAQYVRVENFDGYLSDLRKYNALIKLAKRGFPVTEDKLKEFVSMTAEEIYGEYTIYLNDTFVNIDNNVKTYNGFDELHELIDEADKGVNVGMPLYNAPLLTKEIGGLNLNGRLYGLGAASGAGKSSMAIQYIFPSIMFSEGERAIFIINEEDQTKFRKEALIWVCSNILKKPVPKYMFRDGHFSDEVKATLHEAADYLEAKKEDRSITIIPLERYSAKTVCKIIKKYSQPPFSAKMFIVDTLKESVDTMGTDTWKALERDVRSIYDTCKPTACNVGCFLTYQLSKSALKTKHLTNSDIGQGKSIVDCMDCNLLMRRMEQNEYTGEREEIHVFRMDGKNEKTKIPIKTDKNKYYLITFIAKNRFGETDTKSIISEVDYSINTNKDIGFAIIPTDW